MRTPEHRDELGAPALKLAGFELWIRGRQFANAAHSWDADWLIVSATCATPGARVWVEGPILTSSSLASWASECDALHTNLSGQAQLDSFEPNIRLHLKSSGQAGEILVVAPRETRSNAL